MERREWAGEKTKATPTAARLGLALETDGLLVLHAAGTKNRVALFDEDGQRIRGKDNQEAVELALAREKLSWNLCFRRLKE